MKPVRFTLVLLFLVLSGASLALLGPEPNSAPSDDEAKVKQLAARWEDAWNGHDADALAALLDEDADFITVRGPDGWIKGRKPFQEDHAEKHKSRFSESVWKTSEVHVKFLRPDIALARVLWETKGDKVPHRKHGELRKGIFTWVVEKRDGNWLIIASQNSESMPALPAQ